MKENDKTIDLLKFELDDLKLIWEKIKLQREVMDRYFNYFLLFVTTPLVVLSAILSESETLVNQLFISITCILLSGLGFSFFAMYVKQRKNSLELVKELNRVEEKIKELRKIINTNPSTDTKITKTESTPIQLDKHGADFWVSVIQSLVSSFWFSSGVFLFVQNVHDINLCGLCSVLIAIILLIILPIILTWIALEKRQIWLKDSEQ